MHRTLFYRCFVSVLRLFFQQNRKSHIVPTGLRLARSARHIRRTLRISGSALLVRRKQAQWTRGSAARWTLARIGP
jgi:hypothetical protein